METDARDLNGCRSRHFVCKQQESPGYGGYEPTLDEMRRAHTVPKMSIESDL